MNQHLIEDEGFAEEIPLPSLEARMSEWLRGEYDAALFLDESGATIGYALWQWRSSVFTPRRRVYLRQFFVVRGHRRKGVGALAFRELTNRYWKGAGRVDLDVNTQNEVGQAFWRSLGFEVFQLGLKLERQSRQAGTARGTHGRGADEFQDSMNQPPLTNQSSF